MFDTVASGLFQITANEFMLLHEDEQNARSSYMSLSLLVARSCLSSYLFSALHSAINSLLPDLCSLF